MIISQSCEAINKEVEYIIVIIINSDYYNNQFPSMYFIRLSIWFLDNWVFVLGRGEILLSVERLLRLKRCAP